MAHGLDVGIAFDLRSDYEGRVSGPDDRLEEYDGEDTVRAIASALESQGHRPRLLGGGRRFVEKVLAAPPQLVFNFAEGFGSRSREAHVPAVLEMLGVPFTHSDPLTLAVSLDKAMTKRLVQSMGVPTPAYHVIERPEQAPALSLRYPLLVKPAAEGSSMGIRKSSRVVDAAGLEREVARQLRDYEQPVLIEEFCPGAEFTVGILGTGREARVLGVMEIVPRQSAAAEFVYSLEVKRNWREEVVYEAPAKRPAALLRDIEDVALAAYRALDCRDVGRVDIRLDADARPMFLEINPVPGLDPTKSDIVILARGHAVEYPALIGNIVTAARRRYDI